METRCEMFDKRRGRIESFIDRRSRVQTMYSNYNWRFVFLCLGFLLLHCVLEAQASTTIPNVRPKKFILEEFNAKHPLIRDETQKRGWQELTGYVVFYQ